ncbi:MAG: hypothetical protein LBS35_11110, partial [Synergistaceae bacterium]|nr:hypothetical protein [Synergistaceae bacterium]
MFFTNRDNTVNQDTRTHRSGQGKKKARMALTVVFMLAVLFIARNAAAQPPKIEWEKSFGGNLSEGAYSIQQTSDGGYIIAGSSDSKNG